MELNGYELAEVYQTFRNRPTRLAKGGTNLWIDQGRITPCPKNCFAGSRVETGASFLNRGE